MLYPQLEAKLQVSKDALDRATSKNMIELCKQHLALLDEYRSRLYELQPGLRQHQPTTDPEELLDRKEIREAIEKTTHERNRIQVLLLSFTTVSGYEAVELFNELKYEGHDDWEIRASGVRFRDGNNSDLMTIQEAVDRASLLRREEQVVQSESLRMIAVQTQLEQV